MGKSTINIYKWAILNSYVKIYWRVNLGHSMEYSVFFFRGYTAILCDIWILMGMGQKWSKAR